MFTGLVQDRGRILALERTGDGVRLRVGTALTPELGAGDSIAVNGVCLTAVDVDEDAFTAEVMHETLRRSSLGEAGEGGAVNLELALRASDRLRGGIQQGGGARGRRGARRPPGGLPAPPPPPG